MSLYNLLFGVDDNADFLLALLGLTRKDVGRFRDAYLDDGKIAIYTRNGGGNRDCWHSYDPQFGNEGCAHETWQREEDEMVYLPEAEAVKLGYRLGNIHMGAERSAFTGKRVMTTYYKCLHPDSKDCTCPGCIITYRLPEHPLYLCDKDDEFDCTYATIYFSVPKDWEDQVAKLPESMKGADKWDALFKELRSIH